MGVHPLCTFISAYKDSARRAKYQIYLNISESQPIFNLQKQVKISANRTKKQVYLHFSEVQPNLKPQSGLKLVQNRTKHPLPLLNHNFDFVELAHADFVFLLLTRHNQSEPCFCACFVRRFGIVHASMTLRSLNQNFLAVTNVDTF